MQQDEECDWATEETCYDESWNQVGCASYESGGCPCPTGQERCGGVPEWGYLGYCIDPEFCCENSEELCYDDSYNPTECKAIADGGCPCTDGETKCGGMPEWNIAGYCTEFCCGDDEETCYDKNGNESGCAAYSEGGCECPEGEVKCGATEYWTGTCTTLCCNESEETCYDESYEPTECKSIASGGCPCSDGQVKCYAEPEYNYAGKYMSFNEFDCFLMTGTHPSLVLVGWCVDVCCGDDQETCYNYETGEETCADIASGGW